MSERKIHQIKLRDIFCKAVLNGDKNFEIRKNDRDYKKGDYVLFIPVNEYGVVFPHPIIEKVYEITYVLSDSGWGMKDGYVVFGIKEVKE